MKLRILPHADRVTTCYTLRQKLSTRLDGLVTLLHPLVSQLRIKDTILRAYDIINSRFRNQI